MGNCHFDKKSSKTKKEKTIKGKELAIKNVENMIKNNKNNDKNKLCKTKIVNNDESKNDVENEINNQSKITQINDLWFQEFNWCFSQNKYLIICGKTAIQNETIVKKYMNDKRDIYLHAEFPGSGSCIIINGQELVENSILFIKVLEDANHLIVCKSKCWQERFCCRSYWVYPEQVSKTTESGEYINKGSFIIRGKKNYMAQVKLELGLGIIFVCGKGDNYEEIFEPYIVDKGSNKNKECNGIIIYSAPYRSMGNLKFKARIVPGNQKRGKIITEIKNKFKKLSDNDLEKSYINLIDNKIMDFIPINSCHK